MSDSVDPTARSRWLSLPRDGTVSWTPYAWLIYLATLFVQPAVTHASGATWALTIAGATVFLGSYFRSFWARTNAERVWISAFQFALGVLFSFWNPGGPVLFVYAAGTVARLTDVRRAAGGIAAIAAAGALIGIATDQGIYSLFATLVVVPLIGAVNMHQVRVERTTARLRAAHDEVRRLAAVAERERIGRDLHDVLGHTLSLIVLKSELASKVAAHDAAQAVQEMRDVERVARAALDDVRQTIRGYRPALSEEIERARMLLNAAAIESQIDAPAIALAPAQEETLAFAIREGVTNVVRHSGARHVRIVLVDAPDGLTLEISDDGAGTAIVEGGGLRGMRDRVTALGGSMRRESARGTHLIVRLPRLAA